MFRRLHSTAAQLHPFQRFTTTTRRRWLQSSTQLALALALATCGVLVAPSSPASASARARAPETRIELPELRTRYSATYQNPDGKPTTVFSGGSLHYRGTDGSWLPISTRLVPSGDPNFAWENEANGFRMRFRALLSGEYLGLGIDGRRFTFELEGAQASVGVAVGSHIIYPAAFLGVDLRYDLFPDGLRKTLVLANANVPTSYRFWLTPPAGVSLRTESRPDGAWAFYADAEPDPLFVLAPPFASDRAGRGRGRHFTRADLAVSQVGNRFALDLSLDPNWLNDPERQFPVRLDPTIELTPPASAAHEAVFRVGCGTLPCTGGDDKLWVGGDDFYAWRSALYFDLAARIPSSAYVADATLSLFFESGSCFENPQPCTASTVDAHRLTIGNWWNGATTTNALTYDASVLASYSLPSSSPDTWLFWDGTNVTNAVASWVASPTTNNGFLLKRSSEGTNLGGPLMNGSSLANPPQLEVWYDLPPDTPQLDTPSAGATLDTTTPVLRAIVTDPDFNPLNNDLQYFFRVVDSGGNCTGAQSVISESGWLYVPTAQGTRPTFTVPPGILKDGHNYQWCVKARDEPTENNFRESAWSAVRTVTIRLKKLGIRDYWPLWSRGPIAVNQANGNLVLSVPGPSYPYGTNALSAAVSYNSQAPTTDQGLGPRWVLDIGNEANPPTKLVDHNLLSGDEQFDAVERVSGDGSSDYYTHVAGSNTYLSTPGDGAQLTKNADGSWTLLDSDGAIYGFGSTPTNGAFPLVSSEWVDEAASQTPLSYCFNGTKITSIRNASCQGTPTRELAFVWNSINPTGCPNAILCISGPDGLTWKYKGPQATPTAPPLTKVNDGIRDLVAITYNADPPSGNGLPNKIQNANDLDPTHASPGYDGTHALTITYDASNRVQDVKDGPVSNQTPAISIWTFTYYGTCPLDPAPTRAAHAGTPQGTSRPNDGCTDLKPPRQQGEPTPKVSRTYYDSLGHPIQVTDPLGGVTMAGYDERDQLLWSEDEDGNPTDVTFADVEGNASTNPWVATAKATVSGPDPDGTGPLSRPVTRSRYDETKTGEDLLTTSGGLITDAVRSAGTSGDGRAAPDSSFGIWEGTTNLLMNGGFESNTTGWSPTQATVARITTRDKFGIASMRVTVGNGKTNYSVEGSATLSGPTAGKTFSGSFWVYAEGSAIGKTLSAILREQGGASGSQETTVSQTLAAGWQRLTVTRTIVQNDRTSIRLIAKRPSGATNGEYVDLDGAQIEQKALATPYVETNGASASRSPGRVQAPTDLLSSTTGWVALRFRAGMSSTSASFRLFTWGESSSSERYLGYSSGSFRAGLANGGVSEAAQAATFAVGDTVTVIGAWWRFGLNDGLKVSVNGGPFSELQNSGTASPGGTLFDLGQRG